MNTSFPPALHVPVFPGFQCVGYKEVNKKGLTEILIAARFSKENIVYPTSGKSVWHAFPKGSEFSAIVTRKEIGKNNYWAFYFKPIV